MLLQSALHHENWSVEAYRHLADIDISVHKKIPDVFLIDLLFFSYSLEEIEATLQIPTMWAELFCYLDFSFPVFVFNIKKNIFKEIVPYQKQPCNPVVLHEIYDKLIAINKKIQISQQNIIKNFHPAERRIYHLLKNEELTPVSLEQMANALWGTTTTAHKKTLYTYIHRIKNIINEDENSTEWIIKEKKGFYQLTFRDVENTKDEPIDTTLFNY